MRTLLTTVCMGLMAYMANAQSPVDLLRSADGDILFVAVPQPPDAGLGAIYILQSGGDDVFFEPDTNVIAVAGVNVSTIDGQDGLQLFVVATGDPVVFHADGIHALPDPPGYRLIDRSGSPIDFGLDRPLIIEQPLTDDDAVAASTDLQSLVGTALTGFAQRAKERVLENPESASRVLQSPLARDERGLLDGLDLEFRALDLDGENNG
jgi:hypothetical protein